MNLDVEKMTKTIRDLQEIGDNIAKLMQNVDKQMEPLRKTIETIQKQQTDLLKISKSIKWPKVDIDIPNLNIPQLDTDFAATMRQIERNNYEMVESFKEINKKKGKKK